MPRFRKRPVIIEAEQWFPGKAIAGVVEQDRQIGSFYAHAWIDTLEGPHAVFDGSWIITGVKGEKYPCEDSIFRMTYEPVVDEIELDEPTDPSKTPTETLLITPSQRARRQEQDRPTP